MAHALACALALVLGIPLAHSLATMPDLISVSPPERTSQHVFAGAPCTPSSSELSELHLRGPAKDAEVADVKFFLFRSGTVDFQEKYVNCMARYAHAPTELDKYVHPALVEHMSDGPLLRDLSNHASRVMRMEDANLIVLGEPLLSSYFATLLGPPHVHPCGRHQDMHKDVQEYFTEIKRAGIGKRHRVLAIATDWSWRVAFGSTLGDWAIDIGITLAAVDHLIPDRRGGVRNSVVIPYRAHYLADKASRSAAYGPMLKRSARSWKTSLGRSVSFTFHGRMERDNEGAKRALIRNLTEGMLDVSVHDFTKNEHSDGEVLDAVQATAETMLKSAFCLIPAGDSPSTRRLFDALAAGCVPIIFQDLDHISDNLPFRRTIDWSKIALFAGSLDCLEKNMEASKLWLQSLLLPENMEAVREMRRLGREAYRQYMGYQQPVNVSTALLREFNRDGSLALPGVYFEEEDVDDGPAGRPWGMQEMFEDVMHAVMRHWRRWRYAIFGA